MSYKVFISHSVTPRELGIVYALAEELTTRGIDATIPDRNWNPQVETPARIMKSIQQSDAMVVVGTSHGQHLPWLQRESQFGKKPLFILDSGISCPEGSLRVDINRLDLLSTIKQATEKIEQMSKEKSQKDALALLVVGGLLFMLFAENR